MAQHQPNAQNTASCLNYNMLITLLDVINQKKIVFLKFYKYNKLADVSNYIVWQSTFEEALHSLKLLQYAHRESGADTSTPLLDREAIDSQILIFLHSTLQTEVNKSLVCYKIFYSASKKIRRSKFHMVARNSRNSRE